MLKEKIWNKILKKSKTCACNKNIKQQKLSDRTARENHRLAYNFEIEDMFVDNCCNSLKINLMDLKRILELRD